MRPRATTPTAVITTTGIEHWWTYEQRSLPGVGQYAVNVVNGNLVVAAAADVDLHERGLDLTFRRVYNSQSNHDFNGDDGVPANYGENWTNTFDAHLTHNADGTYTWYDIDGTACTYTPDGNGNWIPCTGEYAQLNYDGTCGHYITKKNGTIYHFFSSDVNCTINGVTGLQGRLFRIVGRNHNNYIEFHYYFDQCGSCNNNASTLNEIDAIHADNHQLTLKFADVLDNNGNNTHLRELAEIDIPHGGAIYYSYNATGGLTEVNRPGNNSGTPSNQLCAAGRICEEYGIIPRAACFNTS